MRPEGQTAKSPINSGLPGIPGVVLAAGQASRFGAIKQLMPWGKGTVLSSVIDSALLAGLAPLLVVLGAYTEEIIPALQPYISAERIRILINEGWTQGQASSLRLAAQSLPETVPGFLTLLADQPQISPDLISAIAIRGAKTGKIVRPLIDGKKGHPVYFPAICMPMLQNLSPDQSGRNVVASFPGELLPWLDADMLEDIDTPAAYEALHQRFFA